MSETLRRMGRVRLSLGFLESLMHFPDLHNIIDIRPRYDSDEFEMLVAGPSLPATEVGTATPTVSYTVTATEDATQMVPTKTFAGKFSAAPSSEENAG